GLLHVARIDTLGNDVAAERRRIEVADIHSGPIRVTGVKLREAAEAEVVARSAIDPEPVEIAAGERGDAGVGLESQHAVVAGVAEIDEAVVDGGQPAATGLAVVRAVAKDPIAAVFAERTRKAEAVEELVGHDRDEVNLSVGRLLTVGAVIKRHVRIDLHKQV